ncbi:MAG: hypothetical protein CVU42_10670 [Chloroflexi bacterium HGW-Chloroflexi-4]|jgi:hypothetical protein|nr:MAG: hypothetical protein CVU42_10670 [Chloroflexi bacterium HGW-Chloroflexi-4]
MKKSWRLFLFLLILISVLLLLIIFQSFLFDNLIEPLARIFWSIIRLVQAIDQKIFWGLLILIGIILFFWLISNERIEVRKTSYKDFSKSENRIVYWKKLISQAKKNKNNQDELNRKLYELTKDVSLSMNEITPNNDNEYQNKLGAAKTIKKNGDFDSDLNQILVSIENKLEINNGQ